MYPLPAPIITSKSLRLLSEMVHDGAVISMLKAVQVYTVTAITEIMTSRLAGIDYTSILDAEHLKDFAQVVSFKLSPVDNSHVSVVLYFCMTRFYFLL